jgi:hypothetical protein
VYWEVVSKGSRTSPEPSFDPLIFPQKSAKIAPGIRPKFFFFFWSVFGGVYLFGVAGELIAQRGGVDLPKKTVYEDGIPGTVALPGTVPGYYIPWE